MDTALDFCSAGLHRKWRPRWEKGWSANRFFDRAERQTSGFSRRHPRVVTQQRGSITATMQCANGTTSRQTISNLVTKLAQPAFGIAAQGTATTQKGFPPGALLLESAFDVGGVHYTSRRPNTASLVMNASGPTFSANNLDVSLKVPCNKSTANVTVRYKIGGPGGGSALGKPPNVSINVPSTVTCGVPTTLAATVSDPDGDLEAIRWYVDAVLLAPSMSVMIFTTGHTLEAVARDTRGATTSAKKVVQCL